MYRMNSGFFRWFGQQCKDSVKSAIQGVIIGKISESAIKLVSKYSGEDEEVEHPNPNKTNKEV